MEQDHENDVESARHGPLTRRSLRPPLSEEDQIFDMYLKSSNILLVFLGLAFLGWFIVIIVYYNIHIECKGKEYGSKWYMATCSSSSAVSSNGECLHCPVIYARIGVANNFFKYLGDSLIVVLFLVLLSFNRTRKGQLFVKQLLESRIVQASIIGLCVFLFLITFYMFQPFEALN